MPIYPFESSRDGSEVETIKNFYIGRIQDSGSQGDRDYACRTNSLSTFKNPETEAVKKQMTDNSFSTLNPIFNTKSNGFKKEPLA